MKFSVVVVYGKLYSLILKSNMMCEAEDRTAFKLCQHKDPMATTIIDTTSQTGSQS